MKIFVALEKAKKFKVKGEQFSSSHALVENFDAYFLENETTILEAKTLFPRKLLVAYSHKKNISEIKSLLFESRANILFWMQNKTTIALTQDGAEFKVTKTMHDSLIKKLLEAKFYETKIISEHVELNIDEKHILSSYPKYPKDGRTYGTFAIKKESGFITSTRGKAGGSLAFSYVKSVDHSNLLIEANYKATLNAPLLDSFFKANSHFKVILHGHDLIGKTVHNEYEFAGTDGDNNFAVKANSGEIIYLPFHGFLVGFDSFTQAREFINEKRLE